MCLRRDIRYDWECRLVQAEHCQIVCVLRHDDVYQDNDWVPFAKILHARQGFFDSSADLPSTRRFWDSDDALHPILYATFVLVPGLGPHLWVLASDQVCYHCTDDTRGCLPRLCHLHLLRDVSARRWSRRFHCHRAGRARFQNKLVHSVHLNRLPHNLRDEALSDQDWQWRCRRSSPYWRELLRWGARKHRIIARLEQA